MKKILLFAFILSFCQLLIAQVTVSLTPDKDNTLYESVTGSLSNGAGVHLFAGKTANGDIRRALIHFDLSTIPVNAVVSAASLQLIENKGQNGVQTLTMHRALLDWGEGTSVASGGQGGGAQATTGDATWLHTFFNNQNWTTVGGDFMSISSATQTTASGTGSVTFTGTQLTADVQGFIDGSLSNFGWVVRGNESSNTTAKRFHAKELPAGTGQPTLTITYSVTTSLSEAELQKAIELYPSPAENQISLKGDLNLLENRIRIYDISGKKVAEKTTKQQIDISELKAGVYFLEVFSREQVQLVKKFIVK